MNPLRQASAPCARQLATALACVVAGLFAVGLNNPVPAQAASYPPGAAAPPAKPGHYRCELGQYNGPAPGRRQHLLERYIWVVTPEFARQYCMPAHTVSAELEGAAAVAFRMVEGVDTDSCGVTETGQTSCRANTTGRYEIYLPQSLKLPAANPDVRFFELRRNTSDWIFDHVERSGLASRYRAGQYQLPAGQIPRFATPFPTQSSGYHFRHLYEHRGVRRWSTGGFHESGFISDVMRGMDLLILDGWRFPVAIALEDLDLKRARIDPSSREWRYVLKMVDNTKSDDAPPVHMIRLPYAFSRQVRTLAERSGTHPATP
jgi:hypothetical protein